MKVPFLDLKSQYLEIARIADRSLKRLILKGDFILGQDVKDFEASFARYLGVKYALGVNSGTDALFLGLLSFGVGPGDEVVVPAYTYIASAFAVTYTGARPVFVDIDERTFTMDPEKLASSITSKTKAIMPVHLYGQAANMAPLLAIAQKHGLKVIEDAAQAHGTTYMMTDDKEQKKEEKMAGSMGDIGCFSFYPTKNLGAFGDGGMVVTNNETFYKKLAKLRDYGRKTRYEHESLGYNSRLDSIQAVFLKQKLKKLDSWNKKRASAAETYRELLIDLKGVILPLEHKYGRHIYHIFAIRLPNRDRVLEGLKKAGISAAVHYPVPLHLQGVYKNLGYNKGDFPAAEKISEDVLCLPIYPHIKKRQIEYVVQILKGLI